MSRSGLSSPLFRRRLLAMALGIVVLAAGIALFKLSLMGNDPSTAFVIAIGDRIGVDFAFILLGMNLLWFLAEWRWSRALIGVGTFVNWFLVGPLASLFEKGARALWGLPEHPAARWLMLCVGVLVLSLACALYQTADLGIAPYDALSLTLAAKTRIRYFWCRIFTDSVCVVIAFALGGIIGAGTLVCALGLGPFIQWFSLHAARPLIYGKS